MREMKAEIAIIGGSLGGCAAALAAAEAGKRVVLTEETAWIGGQLTSQAVPPDEHGRIETGGCTLRYRQFRELARSYYRRHFPVTEEARHAACWNPGSARRIAFEPRTALAVLTDMLAPHIHSGRLTVLTRHLPVAAETDGDTVRAVSVRSLESGDIIVIAAPYFLDATECGDVLPLAGAEYVTGAESRRETGETHALEGDAQPQDMQAITFCFATDYLPGGDFTIDKPNDYEFWRSFKPDFWPDKLLSWTGVYPHTLQPRRFVLFPDGEHFSLFNYRRVLDRSHFRPGTFESDITLVNWQQNDYFLGSVIDVPEPERKLHLERAKQLSFSLLYWLQTEAPRPDGGAGFPGLRLRPDVTGTEDGMAMYPYIRESRRIRAEFTLLERHCSLADNPGGIGPAFFDSVGVGAYHIDLHPSTGGRHYIDFPGVPFQIPLGALLPVRLTNLLPACKNIGTTHISNGCYRLHPVEWNIGESAGLLAVFALQRGVLPRNVCADPELLADYRRLLADNGVELAWQTA